MLIFHNYLRLFFIDAHQKYYNMKNKSVIASFCEGKKDSMTNNITYRKFIRYIFLRYIFMYLICIPQNVMFQS